MSEQPHEVQARVQKKRARFDIQLDRHEAKYIIPRTLVPEIREFIRPFCEPDPHTHGDPPEYVIVTLQLDNPSLSLHYAKEWDAVNRFKLRVRTYGDPVGSAPVFMEVKRKIRGSIVKSRTVVPFDAWSRELMTDPCLSLHFKSSKEEYGFLEFKRLVMEIGAQPVVMVRYTRESYFGKYDHYARVTFDRKLEYQPTTSWTSWGRGGRWLSMDTGLAQGKDFPFSGIVLELKTLSDAPQWMIDMVMHFGLVRAGNCKYSTAVWLETLFRGASSIQTQAAELFNW